MKKKTLYVLVTLLVSKTILFFIITPPWQGPDEPFYFKTAYFNTHSTFSVAEFDSQLKDSLNENNFLKYIEFSQTYKRILSQSDQKMPGYKIVLGSLLGFFSEYSIAEQLLVGRLFSVACYLSIVFFVYQMAKLVCRGPTGNWFSIGALSFVGFHPQYSFFSITVNPDNLVAMLLTISLFGMVLQITYFLENRRGFFKYCPMATGIIAAGIALWVKRSGLVAVIFCFLAMFIYLYRRFGKRLQSAVAVLAVLLLVSGVWYMNNSLSKQADFLRNFRGGGEQVDISFTGKRGDIKVYYEAFNVRGKREVAVLVNGQQAGFIKRTKKISWAPENSFKLPDELVNDTGINTLTFDNRKNPPRKKKWGVRNVKIDHIMVAEMPQGNIPIKLAFSGMHGASVEKLKDKYILSTWEKRAVRVWSTVEKGWGKVLQILDVPPYLILRFILVQFISFWFALGWMIYKMSFGWYALFGLMSAASVIGIVKLIYCRVKEKGFEEINLQAVGLLVLLIFISALAMFTAYAPSVDGSINQAMGRCRFMEIGAVAILVPLGLWALAPEHRRDLVMKVFSCGMIVGEPSSERKVFTPEIITEIAIKNYLAYLKEKGLSPRTRSLTLTALRRFCRWAVYEGYINRNPANQVPRPTVINTAPPELTPEQRYILRSRVEMGKSSRLSAIFALGYWVGLRISEIAQLELAHCQINKRVGQISIMDSRTVYSNDPGQTTLYLRAWMG